jgi:plasmid maintenance system antidote protein VapI
LSRYFGNSARFWMNLQIRYDLAIAERDIGQRIDTEVSQAA